MKRILMLLICLALLAGNTWAIEAQRLPEGIEIPSQGAKQDCTFGNLRVPAFFINETVWLGEWIWIKFIFWPPQDCACPLGFHIDNVKVTLFVSGNFPEPVTFPIWIDLEDGWWRDDLQCWYPGEIDCVTEHSLTVQEAGLFEWVLPMEDCECAFMAYQPNPPVPGYDYGPYLISVRIPFIFDPAIGGVFPVIDGDLVAEPCTSFLNITEDFANFEDLFTVLGEPVGDWMISAESTCCDIPVDIEDSSWGDVKSLFR